MNAHIERLIKILRDNGFAAAWNGKHIFVHLNGSRLSSRTFDLYSTIDHARADLSEIGPCEVFAHTKKKGIGITVYIPS